MTASSGFLAVVISVALLITIVAPLALLIVWFRDWRNGKLW